jgi:hypothetical protein
MIFKNSVPTAQKTYCVTIIKTNRLMQFSEITAVYSENNMKHVHKLRQ